jgi:hypothetical protein
MTRHMAEPTEAEPKGKRRWFQFSLRTLMLAIAIVAVQCAACLPMVREWQRQRDEQRSWLPPGFEDAWPQVLISARMTPTQEAEFARRFGRGQ